VEEESSVRFGLNVDHVVSGGPYHCVFDNSLKPRVRVHPGQVVRIDCIEAAGGQLTPASTLENANSIDGSKVHTISGPIYIEGAEPGDTLVIDILDIRHHGWAWTHVLNGFGSLAERFCGQTDFRIWHVDDGNFASVLQGVKVPVEPFCGVMGVAPKESGPIITIPPRAIGGNMDCKHLRPGTRVYFPVCVPGALFSIGDGHLAQGDGEVCGTALEGPVDVIVRLDLIKNKPIKAVWFESFEAQDAPIESQGNFVTTSTGQDLQQLTTDVVSAMVDLLIEKFTLEPMEAYIICSAAGNLKISVPVLGPRHAGMVTFHMPKSIFSKSIERGS